MDDPQVVIYVVVDEPNAAEQASSTYAQFIAQGILSELLPYLNVEPDETVGGYLPSTPLWEGFKGYLNTAEDTIMDENGNLLDSKGNRIDWDGNRIDSQGYLLDSNGNYQMDEYGMYILSEALDGPTEEEPDGVSNTSAPGPLDGGESVAEGNNMESEGITNEEAGFE